MLGLRVVAFCSVLLCGAFVWDLRNTQNAANTCEMTYSWPVYTKMDHLRHHKYALYRYHMYEYQQELKDIPLVFVPGHLGSYKQVRSIGSHLVEQNPEVYEIFALDFQEEMAGLSGKILLQQSDFLRLAITFIQDEYRKQKKPSPDKFVIVAHSMGGIVALAANLLLPANANAAARRRPITKGPLFAHVVTLGTPLERPPFGLDPDLQHAYDEVTDEMHKLLTRAVTGRVGRRTGVAIKQEQTILESRAHISIAGGHRDIIVHSSLSTWSRFEQPENRRWNGLAALTKAIAGVNTTVDHLCLLWCHQLLGKVAESLLQIVELQTNSDKGKTSYHLMQLGRRRLELSRQTLFGNSILGADMAVHSQITSNGYVDQAEFDAYNGLLPMNLFNFLRSNLYGVLLVLCHVVVLQIVHLQISKWLNQNDLNSQEAMLQGTSVAVELFPSFVHFLSPLQHLPSFVTVALHNAFGSIMKAMGLSKYMSTSSSALFGRLTAALSCALIAIGLGVAQNRVDVLAWATTVETLGLYMLVYFTAVGLLYVIALVGNVLVSLTQLVVLPVHRTLQPKLNRWVFYLAVLLVVFAIGHIKSLKPFRWAIKFMMSREIALGFMFLYVLALVLVLELFIVPGTTEDHTRFKQSIGAFYLLFGVWHIGKVTFLLNAVRLPPRSDPLLAQFGVEPFVLALCLYHLFLVNRFMLPSPPQAPCSSPDAINGGACFGDNEGMPFTAANCPKCVFEDAGPGAIFEEYTDATTKTKGSEVVVGSTFRVVSCDCVFRFTSPRNYCLFCLRSCHLCGGGQGNRDKVQQLQESLATWQSEINAHRSVAVLFGIAGLLEVYFGLYRHREHLVYHFSVLLVLLLVGYQHALGETASLARPRRRSRRQSSSTNKTKNTRTTSKTKGKTKTRGKTTNTKSTTTNFKTTKTKTRAEFDFEPLIQEVPLSSD